MELLKCSFHRNTKEGSRLIHNDAELSFEINARTKSRIKTGIQFTTQDIDTARLIFRLTKDGVPLPLSAVSGKLVMIMSNGSRFIKDVELLNPLEGVAQYTFTADEIKHAGEVTAELNLYYANSQSLSVHEFSFVIEKALIDMDIVPLAEYYIDDFEALRQKINDLYDEMIETIDDLRKKFEDLDNIETKDGAQKKADAVQENLNNHSNDEDVHVTKSKQEKWDAGQLFKLTQDNGAAKYLSGVDFNTVTDTGFYYMSSVTTALNGPVNNNGYLFVHNYGTYAYQEYTSYSSSDSTSSGRRKFMRNKVSGSDSWTTWREFESVDGAQSKVDVHANKTDIHVTKAEKDKWNGSQLSKFTKDDGSVLINISDGIDFHKAAIGQNKTFTFYTASTGLNTPPKPARGIYLHSSTTAGEALALANDGTLWRKSFVSGAWSDWIALETSTGAQQKVDAHANKGDIHVVQADKDKWNSPWSSTWNNVTLINGAQQYTGAPFKFSVVDNELKLCGSFGKLPASGTIVARFAYKPTQVSDLLVPTIGSYGHARFALTTDGELRFDGLSATDSASVTRVSFNEGIPLW
ncbi:BppU family phage baseplate upper protein (plasmid) [Bacillus velezensis]|nr:BppU family phage baseplate upper protein [Bacillus velezensis]QXP99262.1 BppU family phage baseplate upper protein [Bacillus velezensis]